MAQQQVKATGAKSSTSISTLQSAMNQQAETLQSHFYALKTAICMVTQSIVRRPGGTDLDVGTIELPCKSQFSTHGERTEGPPLADSQPFSSKNSSFR